MYIEKEVVERNMCLDGEWLTKLDMITDFGLTGKDQLFNILSEDDIFNNQELLQCLSSIIEINFSSKDADGDFFIITFKKKLCLLVNIKPVIDQFKNVSHQLITIPFGTPNIVNGYLNRVLEKFCQNYWPMIEKKQLLIDLFKLKESYQISCQVCHDILSVEQ